MLLAQEAGKRRLTVCLLILVFLFIPQLGYCGGYETVDTSKAVDMILRLRHSLATFLKFILAFGAIITLVLAMMTMMQGDSSAAKRFFMWVAGLIIGIFFLEFMEKIGGYPNPENNKIYAENFDGLETFSNIKLLIRGILSSVLCMISMVVLTINVIHFMKGDREGLEKLQKWLIYSVAGIGLLSAV